MPPLALVIGPHITCPAVYCRAMLFQGVSVLSLLAPPLKSIAHLHWLLGTTAATRVSCLHSSTQSTLHTQTDEDPTYHHHHGPLLRVAPHQLYHPSPPCHLPRRKHTLNSKPQILNQPPHNHHQPHHHGDTSTAHALSGVLHGDPHADYLTMRGLLLCPCALHVNVNGALQPLAMATNSPSPTHTPHPCHLSTAPRPRGGGGRGGP